MKEFLITEVELKRYSVLREVTEKRLTLKDASKLLTISYRHAIRLKKRFIKQGIEGLKREKPGFPPNLKITFAIKEEIIKLRENIY